MHSAIIIDLFPLFSAPFGLNWSTLTENYSIKDDANFLGSRRVKTLLNKILLFFFLF